jgi:tRNA threonylcarbamoyl adenosine modification protein YjeE
MAKDSQGFGRAFILSDLNSTAALGARIAAGLKPGSVVALEGDLGSGKTTLARTILQALGVKDVIPSPTFTLVQNYETQRMPIRHFDLYRLKGPDEIDELGLEEALEEGATLIEWPERAGKRLPEDMLHVLLTIEPSGGRTAKVHGPECWAGFLSHGC